MMLFPNSESENEWMIFLFFNLKFLEEKVYYRYISDESLF